MMDIGTEADVAAIEIRLSKLQQLFNSLDPSPFHEKDLDADAEEYIVGSVDEFPLQQPLKLVIHLPADQLALAESAKIQDAIHNYFDYRLEEARRRVRFQLREGRIALLIGLLFLFLCTSVRQLVLALGHGTGSQMVAEGLLILGWVAMWRPLQIFLYEWWPMRHHGRVFAKLSTMPVELRLTKAPPA
ncbi:MAG TPA: hypothetical protein VMV26_03445 [Alphaproteobacteria bacterium]|jgi:hypothetical protein|nr:hypothetical protein [Alphaproteobacteria bacterium]